jgi:broad specificity phosphatase PhoE
MRSSPSRKPAFGGWEPAADAQARIVHAVEQIISQASDDGDIAIIGPGGTRTLLYCHLAGVPISRRHEQPAQMVEARSPSMV